MRSLGCTMLVLVAAIGCSSVRVVQRDGCWVKRSEGMFGSSEELGFCSRPQQAVAENDRLTRLVQECLTQADHRWENQALMAWNRNQPIPAQANDNEVVRTCMSQVSAALGLEAENGALKARLAELGQDRESLRTASDRDRQFMQDNSDKMVSALGAAASKPMPAATATATVKSETELKGMQAPPTTVVGFAAPAAAPVIVNPQPAPVLQAPPIEVPAVQTSAAKPSSAVCPSRKTIKKLNPDGTQTAVPACELPLKPYAG